MFMATKAKSVQCTPNNIIVGIIVAAVIIIALTSLANTSLALKENSQGNSGVVRQQCLNGLQNAAVEAGVCSLQDLQNFNGIIAIRETQGIKAAKAACFSQITNQGCRGLCVAAVNCYDLQ